MVRHIGFVLVSCFCSGKCVHPTILYCIAQCMVRIVAHQNYDVVPGSRIRRTGTTFALSIGIVLSDTFTLRLAST